VIAAGSRSAYGRRAGQAAVALLAACALALAFSPEDLRAEAPFEPNDTLATAAGPLLLDQPLTANLEAEGDKDFFYFYVAATQSVRTVLTVENLGGSAQPVSEIDVRIMDPLGAYAGGGLVYVRGGESRSSTVTLEPGKYFVEIITREGYGDTYRLTPGGDNGAFGDYGKIASRCAAATASVNAQRDGLKRAKAKLQRATSRLRRSRYGSRKARQAALALRATAKARVAAKRRALQAATRTRKPWCFIPQ